MLVKVIGAAGNDLVSRRIMALLDPFCEFQLTCYLAIPYP